MDLPRRIPFKIPSHLATAALACLNYLKNAFRARLK